MPEDRRLSLDEKTSKISMTSWVNAIRDYMEEHGLDTVFRIFDSEADSEVYILQDWGKADPSIVTAWESTLETGVGKCSACDYDFDNLKWSGKAIMNSIALDLWETIEKDVGTGANGPRTFAAIIAKIQQVSSSSVRTMVDNLKKLRSINEPGQDDQLTSRDKMWIHLDLRLLSWLDASTDRDFLLLTCPLSSLDVFWSVM